MSEIKEISMKCSQHSQFLILNILQQNKKILVSDKKYSDERVDMLSLVLMAETSMAGAVTKQVIN